MTEMNKLREASTANSAQSVGSVVRVLVAEDEAIIRLDLVETLREEGYEVVGETGRGDEVVALVRAVEPDIAILDIKMPGLDGLSAAKDISKAGLTGVVVLTAFSQRSLVEQARDSGVLGYVVKPFQKAELVAAIEVALGRHRELLALRGQVRSLEQRLEDRKAIDRAKGVLMDRDHLNEREAFARLQRLAMDGRTSMRAIADTILTPDDAVS